MSQSLPFEKSWYQSALQDGDLDLQGQFLHGSNYTFFGKVTYQNQVLQAVYKPTRGEQPLWDFPAGTLAKREVAAYLVSEALGWELVPPTVYRRKAELGPGSLQLFIKHDPNYHYFTLNTADRDRLRPVALFDILVNNADRKGGHVIFDPTGHLWLIDHGICFHVEDKLRTVIWDFSGEPFDASLLAAVARLEEQLQAVQDTLPELPRMLRLSEIRALQRRCRYVVETGCFPEPGTHRRMYPWPPV